MGAPSVTPLQETRHAGGYVVWDPSGGTLTRDAILLASGSGICTAGLVLAALMSGGVAAVAPLGTNAGNGTFGAIAVGAAAKAGTYAVEFDDPTHFIVADPNGIEVGHGTTGAAFAAGGLGFTITAGATAFAAGDSFTITVTGAAKYVPFDPTGNDGRQYPAAILFSGSRDATSADRKAVANVRGPMRVNAGELVWGAGVTTDAQRAAAIAALTKLGILFT